MSSKALRVLDLSFPWEGWEQKEGTECSHKLSQGKQYGKIEKIHMWKECALKIKALQGDLGYKMCFLD